jgi:hypothetical protein
VITWHFVVLNHEFDLGACPFQVELGESPRAFSKEWEILD